jgi:hypothetical protein
MITQDDKSYLNHDRALRGKLQTENRQVLNIRVRHLHGREGARDHEEAVRALFRSRDALVFCSFYVQTTEGSPLVQSSGGACLIRRHRSASCLSRHLFSASSQLSALCPHRSPISPHVRVLIIDSTPRSFRRRATRDSVLA